MKTFLCLVMVLASTLAFAEPKKEAGGVKYSGGDGSSAKTAVIVTAPDEDKGVAAEYAYLAKHFPGYATRSQSLTHEDKKIYDKIDFKTKDGRAMTIFFDITGFFGKF